MTWSNFFAKWMLSSKLREVKRLLEKWPSVPGQLNIPLDEDDDTEVINRIAKMIKWRVGRTRRAFKTAMEYHYCYFLLFLDTVHQMSLHLEQPPWAYVLVMLILTVTGVKILLTCHGLNFTHS